MQYQPRTTIKVQALTDFIAKFTTGVEDGEPTAWMVCQDRLSNQQAGGAGVLLRSPERDTIECVVHLQFATTNNETKYEAVLLGIDLAKVAGATSESCIAIHKLWCP